jgi:N-acetylglucosaminyldiphosphoundecaprenol N-acetyl-beta-D-mannosaminyltransferase
MNVMKILGVRVDNYSREEIKKWILDALDNPPKQKFVTTLNPEIILKAHYDKDYREVLNNADLNICDGFGIKLISFLKGKTIKERQTGADLAGFLLKQSALGIMQVLVIVSKKSLSTPQEIEKAVSKKHPGIKIRAFYFSEYIFQNSLAVNSDLVFVNFGAPEQELFISKNRHRFPESKLLIGIGGTFDFFTKKIKRAPKLFRMMGLEWMWRFLWEPKRFRRIFNAIAVFPFVALIKSD